MKHIIFDHDGTLVNTRSRPELFAGIDELLTELNSRSSKDQLKIYLWTARGRNSTIEILKSLEIIGIFEDISTASDCEPKPAIAGLESMLADIPKSDIIMIGDSLSDIAGGKMFGVETIGVWWDHLGTNAQDALKAAGATYTCETVSQCKDILMQWLEKGKINV